LKQHNSGCYFQNIAKDSFTDLAAIPYKEAEDIGFFKIDFLHISPLDDFTSNKELVELANKEPNWKLLEHPYIVGKLWQISKHYDIVSQVKPKSLIELADVIALTKPNKRILLDKYVRNREVTRKELYNRREKKDMRKSHVIPYAQIIVAQLNLIELGRL
jgi:DNA polymerase III alpha subunit